MSASIWADKHRIMKSTNGGRPEVIAMCKNNSVAMMLVDAWISQMQLQQAQPPAAPLTFSEAP
jgi:hypothetical protein